MELITLNKFFGTQVPEKDWHKKFLNCSEYCLFLDNLVKFEDFIGDNKIFKGFELKTKTQYQTLISNETGIALRFIDDDYDGTLIWANMINIKTYEDLAYLLSKSNNKIEFN